MNDYGVPAGASLSGADGDLEAILKAPRLLELLPVAVYVCGHDGRILGFNSRAARLWGRSPRIGAAEDRFCGAHKLYFDGHYTRHDETPMAHVLRTGEPIHGAEGAIERPDGSRVDIAVHIDPVLDEAGKLIGAINCFHDITARKQAQDKLARRERWFRELLEALPAALYTTDAEGRVTFYNQAAAELWGYHPQIGDDRWCGSWRLYWPDGRPMAHEDCPMATALKENRPIRGAEAMAERPDGSRVPFIPYPTPLHDEAGALLGAVNMLVDITERKEAETQQALLVRELAHRVNNTFAVILAIAQQSQRAASGAEYFTQTFAGRIQALARAHELLFAADWKGVELSELVRGQVAPLVDDAGERLRVDGPPAMLEPSQATALALVLHELATNACKYGALSDAGGHVAVTWEIGPVNGSRELRLSWTECDGPPVRSPSHKGLGSRLIERGLPDARVAWRFEPQGVACTIHTQLH